MFVSVTPELKQRQLWCSSVVLVPYQPHHVPKYNQWMQNVELQYLTGSEPLNLQEEYEMYSSWCQDSNKCTFIVLDRFKYESLLANNSDQNEAEVNSMIGDVNFYILDNEEAVAEIEIMIAEFSQHGKGFGKEAVIAMMKFAHEMVQIQRFQAKIKMSNLKSQNLFVQHLGFNERSRSTVFDEITYENDLSQLERENILKSKFDQIQIVHKVL